jgi:alkylation response protein AidB-like acyl-CoA dehydrogenase
VALGDLVDLEVDPRLDDFREEARTWLEENVPTEPRPEGPAMREYDAQWQRRQYDGGWAGIDWEPEYGGRGLSPLQQIIWYEELVRANAPGHGCFGVAFGHAGPTLIMRGSQEQKTFYLPRILRGETPWCQGFSEPGAGSDLASLRTRAVVDGDDLVITGAKTWTSYGELCDYGELLVRTDPDAPKHRGITWVVMDMRLPGVDIRPIRAMDGYPHNCEVFYDEVRVPLTNVVDKVNNGWSVALSTLAAERGPGFLDMRLKEIAFVDELIDHARMTGQLADHALYDRLAQARAMASALRSMAYYQVSTARKGEMPSAETTATRTFHVQLEVTVGRLAVDILGAKALEWTPWGQDWLRRFSAPIAGGTTDIQKNIIGERVLGLPR